MQAKDEFKLQHKIKDEYILNSCYNRIVNVKLILFIRIVPNYH